MRIPTAFRRLAISAVLLFAARAQAVPLYYTFSGEVVYSTMPEYPLGRSVTYVFLVDRDAQGYVVDGAGTISMMDDYFEAPDYYQDFFLAEYVGGDIIPRDNPASLTFQSSHYGMDIRRYDELFSAVRGSNGDPAGFDLLDIWADGSLFGDWTEGRSVLGENFVSAGGAPNDSYSSTLVLTSIDTQNPFETGAVPEPSAIALFALGLLGIGLSLRKRTGRG